MSSKVFCVCTIFLIWQFFLVADCKLFQMLLPISVEDVKREVKIMQALSGHENVVQFHEAFEDDDYIYIVME